MNYIGTDHKAISIHFANYAPLSFNFQGFTNVRNHGGLKIAFNQGKIYVGSIVEGKRHGWGVIASSKGKIYEGNMKNNERNGGGV